MILHSALTHTRSAVAAGGYRYAGWVTRVYPDDWAVVSAKKGSKDLEVLLASETAPSAKETLTLIRQSQADKGYGWF